MYWLKFSDSWLHPMKQRPEALGISCHFDDMHVSSFYSKKKES
jgi:hypothetical protein